MHLGLNAKIDAYRSNAKRSLTAFGLNKQITFLKNNCEWLKDAPSQALQMAMKNMDSAFQSFCRGGGYPKFKAKHNKQSFQLPQGVEVNYSDGKIFLPKLKWIKCCFSHSFSGQIKTSTVSQTPSGRYFISVLVETNSETPEKKEILETSTVGIDLGIKDFAILSDGHKQSNPKYLKQSLRKLKRQQKRLSHMIKGSNNRNKQRRIVSRLHEKVSNQRLDFLHKLSTKVIRENQSVALEDLNVKGMTNNHKLDKVQ